MSAIVGLAVIAIAVLGLVLGGGDPAHWFGADWSQVDWPAVATMLLIVAILFAVLVPLAWFLLPRSIRRVGTAFVGLAVIAPLGLIAPGFAFGEGSVTDVKDAFGYVPQGLQDLSGIFSAPLSGYDIPLPFFSGADSALWHEALGYEIAGIVGMLLTGLVILVVAQIVRPRRSTPEPQPTAPAS